MESSISGLASGIQWGDLIDGILAVERRPVARLEAEIETQQIKTDAWDAVRTLLQNLNTATTALSATSANALDAFSVALSGFPTASGSPFQASVSAEASPGTHTVRVLARAEAEMVGGALQASRSDPLGLSGEVLINGRAVQVEATDALEDIAGKINAMNTGSSRSGVGATVASVDGSFRLLLAASETGVDGIQLADPDGILQSLGLVDSTTALRNQTASGFTSDSLADDATAVSILRGLTGGSGVGTIQLGTGANQFSVAIDLTTMTLSDVASAINTAAGVAGSGVTAAVEAAPDGGMRLAVAGTASYVDAGGVLEILGAVEGGRSAVAQQITGGLLATDGAGTPASAATALTALFTGGVASGVTAGDTLTFQGTRGDGTTFSFVHTVGGGDTLQTILDRLNGSEGYNGAATASISAAGALTVTDGSTGASLLDLAVLAGNEGGGVFDPGAFTVSQEGRRRAVAVGADALIEVNGSFLERSSNTVTDAIAGVTLNLSSVDANTEVDLTITRDVSAAVSSIQALVDAYNEFTQFVDLGVGVTGNARPQLAGDAVLRNMRSTLQASLQSQILQTLGGGNTRLGDVGIEIQKDRTFQVDTAVLTAALEADFTGVSNLFRGEGFTSTSALSYVGATGQTAQGQYDVFVTAAGSAAALTSTGALATYVDDGVADLMSLTDLSTNRAYEISVGNGDTLQAIVDRMNTELATPQARELSAAQVVYSDAGATTAADENTLLSDLFYGDGSGAGFTAGTVVTFSGTAANGVSFLRNFTVTDPSTQTLGDLRDALGGALAGTADVTIENGAMTVRATNAGTSLLAVTVGSDIAGNASFLGNMDVQVEGRNASSLVAEVVGTEIEIRTPTAGSAHGFTLGFTAGGTDGTAGLGLAAGTYQGTDVAGTIGGEPATGVGLILTSAAGSAAEGLAVGTGTGLGDVGTVTYSRGVAASMELVLKDLLGTDAGSVTSIQEGLDRTVTRLNERVDQWEGRLELRREQLIRKFTALEEALARAQSQSAWLTAQFASLNGGSQSNG